MMISFRKISVCCVALGLMAGCDDDTTTPTSDVPAADQSPLPDSTAPDSTVPDAAAPDGNTPDAAAPDGGAPEAGTPDATAPDVTPGMGVFQSSGGIHRTPGVPLATQGTAIFMRLRATAGTPPAAPVMVTVTGPMSGSPLGWNAGMPLTLTYPMGGNFFGAYPGVSPMSGNYVLAATLDGAPVSTNFNLDTSAPPTLEPSASLTLSNVSTAQVDGTWQAVTGAVSYRFAVRDTSTSPPTILRSVRVTTTSASLTMLTLDRSRTTYDAEVLAYPVDLSPADVTTPPPAFNVSFRRVAVVFP